MESNGAKRETSPDLSDKIKNSLNILNEAFQQYETKQLFLSFNGGKDCTVLLNLLKEHHKSSLKELKVIYLRQRNPFPEIESFVDECKSFYDIKIHTIEANGAMKEILRKVCENDRELAACVMGCRRTDPFCQKLKSFEETDSDWPKLMRVNPLLDWSCANIWEYIMTHNVPYCELYNRGFTSIGNKNNTVPNPYLKNEDDDSFKPAFELLDDALERAGRT